MTCKCGEGMLQMCSFDNNNTKDGSGTVKIYYCEKCGRAYTDTRHFPHWNEHSFISKGEIK